MNALQELENFISEFNQNNDEDFSIDSIRVEFSKQHKQEELKALGKWGKIKKNSPLLSKLKRRLTDNEITSVWRLETHNIYYYNIQDAPKYRRATLVVFGMKQYHKDPPPRYLITSILEILKDVSNVDICLDLPYKPNLEALNKKFTLTPFVTNNGVVTDTSYINDTGILMVDKIIVYNKALKNGLNGVLWRIEATISIPNFKALMMPLYEFKQITNLLKVEA